MNTQYNNMPQRTFKSICVFCGSSLGARQEYIDAAHQVANVLIEQNITLIYGAAQVGLMGKLADAMLSQGGKVIGVMPKVIAAKEIAHTKLTELHFVDSMHERKALMTKLSDAFIMLPGANGSLEEFFEIMTLAQLNVHDKPFGILNVKNYYDSILDFIDHAVAEKFLKPELRDMILVEKDPKKLFNLLSNYQKPVTEKWMELLEL